MPRQFHLIQYLMPPVHHHSTATWKHPRNMQGGVYEFDRPDVWQYLGQLCERANFDAIFFADTQGVYSEWEDSPDAAIRYATQVPCFEPSTLMSFVAAATTHIGLAITLDTTGYYPYVAARKFATLDHLSRGRAAWNVVTGFHRAAFQNFGIDEVIDHDERYERAEEFVEICYQLWDSWDADAIVMDRESDMFADPARVHEINYKGRWYSARGPLNIHRSPQGRPVIVQAGASERGRDFAARHAEVIFAGTAGDSNSMKAYYDDVKSRMVNIGRDPNDCKIFYAMQPWVGETSAIAQEKRDLHNAMTTAHAGLVWSSGTAGVDFSELFESMDEPANVLAGVPRQGIGGGKRPTNATSVFPDTLSVKDIALNSARGAFTQVAGTGVEVADWMEETMEVVGGDGFFISPAYVPASVEEFISMVIPELRHRGLVRTGYVDGGLRANLLAF